MNLSKSGCHWRQIIACAFLGALLAGAGSSEVNGQDYSLKTLGGKSQYEAVFSVAFSPDGKMLASGTSESGLKLWDLQSGTLIRAIDTTYGYSVAFSPDGRTLAYCDMIPGSHHVDSNGYPTSVEKSYVVKLIDTKTGISKGILKAHPKAPSHVKVVVFSPDGNLVATVDDYSAIRLWDPQSAGLKLTINGHRDVRTMAFSPDGKTLAVGCGDRTLKLLDTQTGRVTRMLLGETDDSYKPPIHSVAFSPDGKTLASDGEGKTDNDNPIQLWNPETGTLKRTLKGHRLSVNSLAFSPDGKTLASGSSDNTIKLWDPQTGVDMGTLKGHEKDVFCIAFSRDGNTLASGSRMGGTIKLWDIRAEPSQVQAEPTQTSPAPAKQGGVEWTVAVGGNGHFYEPVTGQPGISWDYANQAAQAAGGYLVAITSAAENDFVFNLIDKAEYWTDSTAMYGPWIGCLQTPGSSEPNGGWKWANGETFTFAKWESEQPNNWGSVNEDRVIFGLRNGRTNAWCDVRRDHDEIRAYVIEFDSDPNARSQFTALPDSTSSVVGMPLHFEPGTTPSSASTDSPASSSASSLEGEWKVVAFQRDGQAGAYKTDTLYRFADGRATVQVDGKPSADLRYTIDASKTPQQLDLSWRTANGEQLSRMIFQVDGDELVMCYPPPAQSRPTSFNAERGNTNTLIKMRRNNLP